MRYETFAIAAAFAMSAMAAVAQTPAGADPASGARPGHEVGVGDSLPLSNSASNIVPSDTHSAIAPTLPHVKLGADATPHDYLSAARASVVAGHTGRAQQLLEMAETRALDRSVPQGSNNVPSDSPLIGQIRDARHALGGGNRTHAVQIIDLALAG